VRKQLALLVLTVFTLTNTWVVHKAFAVTTRARYVKTGCANNGDGTANSCAASGGAAGAFNSLTNAITADASRNLVSNDEVLDITVSGATVDTWNGDFQGITSDATRYVRIHGDSSSDGAHAGIRDNAKFHILHNTAGGAVVVRNLTGCSFSIENIQITSTANDASAAIGVHLGSSCTAGKNTLLGNIITYEPTGTPTTSSSNNGIYVENALSGKNLVAVNNLIYGFTQNGIFVNHSGGVTLSAVIYNNTTVSNSNYGIAWLASGSNLSLYIKNNYAASNTSGQYFRSGTPLVDTHSNNISSDTTSPDAAFQSKTCSFVNTGTKDYHLVVGDTNCRATAADLTADAQYPFSVDYEQTARGIGAFDIGADQYGAAPTPTPTPTPTPDPITSRKGQKCSAATKGQCLQ
jgi:hypothetical protein